jgi:uncharacterized membrane protein
MEKTSSGLDENVAGALAYALGWLTGAVFLVIEPTNRFVRFHAWQSVFTFGALSVAWIFFLSIPFLGWIFAWVVILPLSVAVWLWMMFKAYQGERYKLPYAGDMAEHR